MEFEDDEEGEPEGDGMRTKRRVYFPSFSFCFSVLELGTDAVILSCHL
ncbi:hypothetical protein SLEP1_g41287 [Rubroshorea leprosula]|uniref:Uncharacterized protein n=1 Tax=Rubroshorea leprosula TaxID=152421 RepID=A0AAV5L6L5_9ROSI|nr:hypothetical protein SLEP1_g41287 [Rubroshorea leprosula]